MARYSGIPIDLLNLWGLGNGIPINSITLYLVLLFTFPAFQNTGRKTNFGGIHCLKQLCHDLPHHAVVLVLVVFQGVQLCIHFVVVKTDHVLLNVFFANNILFPRNTVIVYEADVICRVLREISLKHLLIELVST